jgi:hypothetical protein
MNHLNYLSPRKSWNSTNESSSPQKQEENLAFKSMGTLLRLILLNHSRKGMQTDKMKVKDLEEF